MNPPTAPATDRPSLRDRKKDATRQTIEDVAWKLFSEHGYEATTVNQIADAANVAPRTFFRYFPTKEAVLYPELESFIADLRRGFLARPVDEPPLVSLVAVVEELAVDMSGTRRRQRQRFEIMKKANIDMNAGFFTERVAEAVADMVREREPEHPDRDLKARLAASVLVAVVSVSNQCWLEGGAKGDPEDAAVQCFDIVRDLVGAPPLGSTSRAVAASTTARSGRRR